MGQKPSSHFRVLHVLTLNGSRGEYGGPNKVSYELAEELRSRGHEVKIFSGVLLDSMPEAKNVHDEIFEPVSPLLKSLPVSSLWSNRLLGILYRLIKQSDVVHIHFARDLIPMLTGIICILMKKPFVTQTHGMVVSDSRFSIRILDVLCTKFILKRSKMNFVLTKHELRGMAPLSFKCNMVELPNGISLRSTSESIKVSQVPKVVFCSRLHMRKRPHSFLGLAKFANLNGIDAEFIIYGADGGELESIQNIISTDSNIGSVTYLGALSPNDVQKELGNCDLLVLPSENEPFPMVVLESLSVGTPVLIMPSSGIADLLSSHHPEMVAKSDSDLDLSIAFANLLKNHLSILSRSAVQNTCRKLFDLDKVVDVLEFNYRKVLRKL